MQEMPAHGKSSWEDVRPPVEKRPVSALTAVTGLGVNSQEFVVSERYKLGKDGIRRACDQKDVDMVLQ